MNNELIDSFCKSSEVVNEEELACLSVGRGSSMAISEEINPALKQIPYETGYNLDAPIGSESYDNQSGIDNGGYDNEHSASIGDYESYSESEVESNYEIDMVENFMDGWSVSVKDDHFSHFLTLFFRIFYVIF